jgi:hypothetical protein
MRRAGRLSWTKKGQQGSYTRRAVEIALSDAEEVGGRTELLNLVAYSLPLA